MCPCSRRAFVALVACSVPGLLFPLHAAAALGEPEKHFVAEA